MEASLGPQRKRKKREKKKTEKGLNISQNNYIPSFEALGCCFVFSVFRAK